MHGSEGLDFRQRSHPGLGGTLRCQYSDSTGDIGAILFSLIFFMGLYGAPALLVRELARRSRWGWASLLLLCTALAILQACVIDQSMFAEHYGGYAGWEESRSATFIPLFGISAYSIDSFIVGHVIFSFAGPIAIAEAWRPERADEPWLGPFGMIVAAISYVATATLVFRDPGSQSASQTQLTVSLLLTATCVLAAALIGRRGKAARPSANGRVSPLTVLALTFAVDVSSNFAGQGWIGTAVGLASKAVILAMIVRIRMHAVWTPSHYAAVALGFLFSRGVLAFTYFPLAGEVEPLPKYLHNAGMLTVVLVAGFFALKAGEAVDQLEKE